MNLTTAPAAVRSTNARPEPPVTKRGHVRETREAREDAPGHVLDTPYRSRPDRRALMHWLRYHTKATGTMRELLGFLLDVGRGATNESFWSVPNMGAELTRGERQTRRLLAALEDLGHVVRHVGLGMETPRGYTNRYEVIVMRCTCGRDFDDLGRPRRVRPVVAVDAFGTLRLSGLEAIPTGTYAQAGGRYPHSLHTGDMGGGLTPKTSTRAGKLTFSDAREAAEELIRLRRNALEGRPPS